MRHRASTLLLLVAAGTACGDDDGAKQERDESAISGGAVELGYPAIGLLLTDLDGERFHSACTGTLIDETHVLTAAHCVTTGRPFVAFVLGNDLRSPTTRLPSAANGRAIATKPDAFVPEGFAREARCPVLSAPDVAIVELVEPVRDVRPMELSFEVPPPGTEATTVGFGVPEAGRKRSAREQVVRSLPQSVRTIAVTGMTQLGDSGGPIIDANGRVFGVVSCGTADASEYATLRFARSFIEGVL